ncbi:hypothetical protein F4808DRAFT_294517 [Astrocystis sublimbata]|nr:hypothetical protein F4808DRAFT_294517 [Astrocystis sublimbata]
MSSEDENILLPSFVDNLARSSPSRILYSFAKTKNAAEGFRDVSAAEFARAVDRGSWFIDQTLGGPGKDFPTLIYIGPQDLNYGILVLASIKTGYKLLLVSPRNTLEANLSLLQQMKCDTFLTPPNFPLPVVKKILDERPMRHVEVRNVQGWLDDGDEAVAESKPYPYTKTYAEAKQEPFVVLHSSGSTGLPKPIVQTHATIAVLSAIIKEEDAHITFPSVLAGDRAYSMFPLFHCAGLHTLLPGALYAGYTAVLASFPPSATVMNDVHVHGNVQHSLLVPSALEELAREPEYLDNLSRLKTITFGGGPVPKVVGDLVITKTKLFSNFGSTEAGAMQGQIVDDRRDWQYTRLHPKMGYEYRPVSDGLYEQVFVRDEKLLQYQGIFGTFPELTDWPMKDVFSKHPDPAKGNLWLYQGRSDDILVYSTGEKIYPIKMETMINGDPAVNSCLVVGQGRFQSALLVEAINPPSNAEEEERLREAIWPTVQEANKECPSHGRIHREMIIFTTAVKPMLRAGKGTPQRRLTLDLYALELDALYKSVTAPSQLFGSGNAGSYSSVDVAVKSIVASSSDIDAQNISPDNDLFELGLDSLQITAIVRKLNEYLASNKKPQSVAAKTVYSNPTLASLIDTMDAIINGGGSSKGSSQDKMQELYQLHSENMPISGREPASKSQVPRVVLMTGSTGSLGSYILDSLQTEDHISRVYCLCRGPGSIKRQESLLASKGLRPLSDKVQCLDADLTKPYFGLPKHTYRILIEEVTHVIHNAWQVDFNLSIASFARHVGFVRRLVDFASHSRFGAEIFFVSSISAVSGMDGTVPEKVYTDWSVPLGSGYGQSKFVSERILDVAAREAGVPTVVCRVGQVAGPTTTEGKWSENEWLPSLIASSRYLGKLPDSLGAQLEAVDWIPVDKLGKVIAELAIPEQPRTPIEGATVYHTVNPHTTTWTELLPTVCRRLSQEKEVEVVSLEAWVNALRESAPRTEDIGQNPAVKLLDFFESLLDIGATSLSTEQTAGVSPTLSNVGPVQDKWMENWMTQWGF